MLNMILNHKEINDMNIRLAGIVPKSIADGPGFRYVIFSQGCPHHCPGCHNLHTHNYDGGYVMNIDDLYADICKNKEIISGVTFSGGEPFEQPDAFTELSKKLKNDKLNILAYTGYMYEYLKDEGTDRQKEMLSYCDILIDGEFDITQKTLLIPFRGSRNQRIIDVHTGSVIDDAAITTYFL